MKCVPFDVELPDRFETTILQQCKVLAAGNTRAHTGVVTGITERGRCRYLLLRVDSIVG